MASFFEQAQPILLGELLRRSDPMYRLQKAVAEENLTEARVAGYLAETARSTIPRYSEFQLGLLSLRNDASKGLVDDSRYAELANEIPIIAKGFNDPAFAERASDELADIRKESLKSEGVRLNIKLGDLIGTADREFIGSGSVRQETKEKIQEAVQASAGINDLEGYKVGISALSDIESKEKSLALSGSIVDSVLGDTRIGAMRNDNPGLYEAIVRNVASLEPDRQDDYLNNMRELLNEKDIIRVVSDRNGLYTYYRDKNGTITLDVTRKPGGSGGSGNWWDSGIGDDALFDENGSSIGGSAGTATERNQQRSQMVGQVLQSVFGSGRILGNIFPDAGNIPVSSIGQISAGLTYALSDLMIQDAEGNPVPNEAKIRAEYDNPERVIGVINTLTARQRNGQSLLSMLNTVPTISESILKDVPFLKSEDELAEIAKNRFMKEISPSLNKYFVFAKGDRFVTSTGDFENDLETLTKRINKATQKDVNIETATIDNPATGGKTTIAAAIKIRDEMLDLKARSLGVSQGGDVRGFPQSFYPVATTPDKISAILFGKKKQSTIPGPVGPTASMFPETVESESNDFRMLFGRPVDPIGAIGEAVDAISDTLESAIARWGFGPRSIPLPERFIKSAGVQAIINSFKTRWESSRNKREENIRIREELTRKIWEEWERDQRRSTNWVPRYSAEE